MCQSHTGHMTGLWFLPTRPLRLNTNEWINLMEPEVHYRVQHSPPLAPVLSYRNPANALTSHFSQFIVMILPSMPRCSKLSISFRSLPKSCKKPPFPPKRATRLASLILRDLITPITSGDGPKPWSYYVVFPNLSLFHLRHKCLLQYEYNFH